LKRKRDKEAEKRKESQWQRQKGKPSCAKQCFLPEVSDRYFGGNRCTTRQQDIIARADFTLSVVHSNCIELLGQIEDAA